MQILFIIREVLATPALLVGLVTLFGLLLQKKHAAHIVKGTITTIVGFVLLSTGSYFLQNGALKDFSVLFNYDFNIQGVIPNMEAVSSLGFTQHAVEVSMIMLFGMIANVIIARFGPFPYIFLTGHHTLYMACLLTIAFHQSGMSAWQITVAGSLVLGFLMSMLPALIQKEMEQVTGNNKIALGHFSTIGYIIAAKTSYMIVSKSWKKQLLKNNKIKIKSTEDINFPHKLSFMRDSTVNIFIVMTVMFLISAGIAASRTDLSMLDISYYRQGFHNWVIYSLIQGAQFSGAIYIILAGVRMVIAEIVPAFKGIAKKIVPNAKPAVDCPVLFSYAPNAVMIGFLMSFLGGIVTMLILIMINACYAAMVVPVIVPGVAAHFFCGGSAGVFANAQGGVKGCIFSSFVHGILISILALVIMPMLGNLNISGTTFSDSDFCLIGIVFGSLSSVLTDNVIFILCVFCFVVPILVEQVKRYKNITV